MNATTTPTHFEIGAERTAYQLRLSETGDYVRQRCEDTRQITKFVVRSGADDLAEAIAAARITSAAVSAYGCTFVAVELIERDTGAVVPFDVLPVQAPQACRRCNGGGEVMFHQWHTGKSIPVSCGDCHGTGYVAVTADADGQLFTVGDVLIYNATGERYMALDVVPCCFGYGGGNVWVRKILRGADGVEFLEDGYFGLKSLPAGFFRLSKGDKLAGREAVAA